MRGLIKATAYYNNIEARRAYLIACRLTGTEPAEGYEEMGYRRVDTLREKVLVGTKWEGMTDAQLEAAADRGGEDGRHRRIGQVAGGL
jgi:hypothetical protein